MTELPSRLSAALADRYTLERELGRGGMATVYLAHDLRHDRQVALKVLHPELAATLGPERFQREIRTTARLQHPHILPVLDSGKSAEQLWYTMPYVRGESLRDRLRREGQLPVDTAIELTKQVALALDYAHREGVIHRDLKPENVLLTDGQALVADFGVAKAVNAAGEGQLTETGLVLGTPAYMSPEQATGAAVDTRSDIYALGCVLYEMLAGEPPFTGPTPQAVIAKRMLEPVPHVRTLRDTVPEGVEHALTRALARTPADRFQTAAEFAQSLGRGEVTGPSPSLATEGTRPSRSIKSSRRVLTVTIGSMMLGAAVMAISWLSQRRKPAKMDADLLAVAPFDVLDPKLQLWHEGLVDVLARNLDGAGPLRTVSPTLVIRRWKGRADRESAIDLAKRTGAELTVFGSLVPGGRDSVRLAANVVSATTGQVVAEVEARGPAEHVDLLADSLSIRLLNGLGRSRPAAGARTTGLGTHSLPALRAFLRGEQFFRRTEWDSARVNYEQAIALDSMFALAYWRLGTVRGWVYTIGDSLGEAYSLRAGALNHGLPPRESLLVVSDSLVGTLNEPASIDSASRAHLERLFRTVDQLTNRYPTDPESWVALGEARQHFGHGRGVTYEMTLDAFNRAIALDSSYTPAYIHPVQLAITIDDRAAVQRYAERFLALRPGPEQTRMTELDRFLFDPGKPASALEGVLDTLPASDMARQVTVIYLASDTGEVAIRLLRRLASRKITEDVWYRDTSVRETVLAIQLAYRGHLRESWSIIGRHPELMGWGTFMGLALAGVVPADTADMVFRRWLREEPGQLGNGFDMLAAFPPPWWASRRDTTSIKLYGKRLASPSGWRALPEPYWRSATAAYLALARADTADAIRRLQALPLVIGPVWYERLVLARLLTATGRDREAFALLDRGFPYAYDTMERVPWALEHARLAEKLGDREKAKYWYGYVSRVWWHADPELRGVTDEAREALQRLTSEGTH